MKKRILSLLTLLCMVTALLPTNMITVLAYTGTKYGDYLYYKVESNGEITITDCDESAMEIVIPDGIDGKKVTSIGSYAFSSCSGLTSVTIPDSVTSIGGWAFWKCDNLTNVYICDLKAYLNIDLENADSVPTYQGHNLYLNKELLKEVVIPEGVEMIPQYVFYENKNITSVTIPDSVTSIGTCAFWSCYALNYITIPDSVTSVAEELFGNCYVENVLYCGTEEQWDLLNLQNTYLEYNKIYYNVVSVQEINGIKYLAGKDYAILLKADISIEGNVTVPDTIDNIPVTQISDKAFYECEGLTSITIPESVKSIGNYGFYMCNKLTDITIPDSVTSIGKSAFSDCSSLTSVTIGNSVASIGQYAFYNCNSIESVYITNLSTYLNIDYYDVYAIPTRVAEKLYINGKRAQKITIPDSVARIPDYAFYNIDSIEKVTIEGNNLVEIGKNAFYSCINLTDINIPCSVKKIQAGAFANCYKLDVVYITDIVTWCNIEFENNFAHPFVHHGGDLYLNEKLITELELSDSVTEIKDYAFYRCRAITKMLLPETITNIGKYAFYDCGLTSIVIPNSVSSIEGYAFSGCELLELEIGNGIVSISGCTFSNCSLLSKVTLSHSISEIESNAFAYCNKITTVNYNGNEDSWNDVYIASSGNESLKNATRNYFWYVTLIDEKGEEISKKRYALNALVDISDIEPKFEHTIHLFTDKACKNEFDFETTPITENLTLYLKYIPNQYNAKFVDDDGTVLQEGLIDYGAVITPPQDPTKERTQKYTYTFIGWDGFYKGTTQTNKEMVFTAKYDATINKYTYKFLDNDNTVLIETTVDYGTVITPPETPADKDPYTFDYWDGYTSGAELTDNVEFKAVYKYKTYTITAEGLDNSITATYNSNYTIKSQTKDGYNFIGYFTETNGKGTQITNEKGESLKAYDVVGDLTVYPYFEATHYNQVELQGATAAMPGDTIKEKAIFATDKEAMYVTAIVKYPEYLNFKSISGGDFAEASKDSETVKDGYKYLNITCIYDYDGGNMPINKNLVPFEITFDVATNAPIENTNISVENITLIGNNEYSITGITNRVLEIMPKLAESVSITGNGNIDKTTKYSAVVLPDCTTDKTVTWSVDNEEIATISQDGTLTPLKNGTVAIKATAKDGSGEFGTKTVNVTAYAKINSLKYNDISLDIVPDKYEYTIYVKNDVSSISITPIFTGGTLKLNGSGIWISGRTKDIDLTDIETTILLNRNNVTDMTDNIYNIKVIKFEGTQTTVSEDGKTFTVKPINIENSNTVILVLYNGKQFVEMQSVTYSGDDIQFTTDKAYTTAKVMVWNSLENMMPICEAENIKIVK